MRDASPPIATCSTLNSGSRFQVASPRTNHGTQPSDTAEERLVPRLSVLREPPSKFGLVSRLPAHPPWAWGRAATVPGRVPAAARTVQASVTEDMDFGQRLLTAGHRIRFDDRLAVRHLKHYTFSELLRTDLREKRIVESLGAGQVVGAEHHVADHGGLRSMGARSVAHRRRRIAPCNIGRIDRPSPVEVLVDPVAEAHDPPAGLRQRLAQPGQGKVGCQAQQGIHLAGDGLDRPRGRKGLLAEAELSQAQGQSRQGLGSQPRVFDATGGGQLGAHCILGQSPKPIGRDIGTVAGGYDHAMVVERRELLVKA